MIKSNFLVLSLVALILSTNQSLSQSVPLKFNYQISLRDINGNLISDRLVSFRVGILNNNNNLIFQEDHKNIPTLSGISSFIIGSGINKTGAITTLTDLSDEYFIEIEFDENNGNSYKKISRSQLITVPYSFIANNVAQNGAKIGQVLKWNGSNWAPSEDLNGGSGGTSNLSGDVVGLTTSNIISKLQGKLIAATNPSSGQVLKYNGSTWVPDSDNTGSGSSTLFGDVTGSLASSKVVKLQGRDITSSTPSNGNILKYDGSKWELSTDLTSTSNSFWDGNSTYVYNSPTTSSLLIGTSIYPSYNPKLLVKGNSSFINSNDFRYFNVFTQNNNGQINLNSPSTNYYSILGYFNNSNRPVIGIADVSTGTLNMGMSLNASNQFTVTANIKSFIMDHPKYMDKLITYACIEGPEAAAYERGTIKLVNGRAEVKFSEHFELVINPSSMTVNLTPLSKFSKGLAVTSKKSDGIIIEELNDGIGNYEIDWEVKAVRKGYEDFKVIRDKSEYQVSQKADQD